MRIGLAALVCVLVGVVRAQASPDEKFEITQPNSTGIGLSHDLLESTESPSLFLPTGNPAPGPEEIFKRTQAVLKYFKAPPEPDAQSFLDEITDISTPDTVSRILPYLDPGGYFASYSKISSTKNGPAVFRAFQDRESKKTPDFSVTMNAGKNSAAMTTPSPKSFAARIRSAQNDLKVNPANPPLIGLRIALDPGHMGGYPWDVKTGKFVEAPDGRILSEGLLVLQAALLLEEKLRKLGAEVFLTRRSLGPVTRLSPQNLDVAEYGRVKLRDSTLLSWFQSLVHLAPAGPSLFRSFENNSNFQNLFAETTRDAHFISGADLEARSLLINSFRPDITLVIHLDTNDPPANPTGIATRPYNFTKAYVAGSFGKTEFSSRSQRMHFARHLFDAYSWDASVQLSRHVVGSLSSTLGISRESRSPGSVVMVEPGVFARNLHLTRKIYGMAMTYLECLFYNDPEEFERLAQNHYSLKIDGISYPYSSRLLEVADALEKGIVRFVQSYNFPN
jgi:N-acetylmuramoyl-L-alanine amidase